MTSMAEQVVASYRACRRLTFEAGSSFPAAFRLLPAAKRQAMHALYAFMRHSDDLADDPPPGRPSCEVLRQWRAAFEKAISSPALSAGAETTLAAIDPRGWAILPAVVQTVREFLIPPESLLAVLDGVAMDMEPRMYATFDELAVYCERVASAVGVACIHIWGLLGNNAADSSTAVDGNVAKASRSAGLALQLTNILRDLSEDARRGRVYVPLDDLRACGYSAEELQQGVVNQPFLRLMEMEIARAEQFYREAAQLPRWLHKDGYRIFGLMMETYHALLQAIGRRPADVFRRRVRVSGWKKLWLAARWGILPVSQPWTDRKMNEY